MNVTFTPMIATIMQFASIPLARTIVHAKKDIQATVQYATMQTSVIRNAAFVIKHMPPQRKPPVITRATIVTILSIASTL